MSWKKVVIPFLLIFAWGLTACHAVDENESQLSLAKSAQNFVSQAQASAHSVVPSIPLPKAVESTNSLMFPVTKYWVQENNPAYISNFAHPESGCNWSGIAGQVFDVQGNPVPGMTVSVMGTLNGAPVTKLAVTGTTQDGTTSKYGPAAYEINLGAQAVDSTASLVVQLLDEKLNPMSQPASINTYKDCQQNLVIVNFVEMNFKNQYVLPMIYNNTQPNPSN